MARFAFALACLACVACGRRVAYEIDTAGTPSEASLALAEYLLAVAQPVASRCASRRTTPKMSHFSTIKTIWKEKDLLTKSLKDLGYNISVAEPGEKLKFVAFEGQLTDKAEIVLHQKNGDDIGFKYDGEKFQMVLDMYYWCQPISMENFTKKLSQKYAVNTILSKAEREHFAVQNLGEDRSGKVKLKLTRWATPQR